MVMLDRSRPWPVVGKVFESRWGRQTAPVFPLFFGVQSPDEPLADGAAGKDSVWVHVVIQIGVPNDRLFLEHFYPTQLLARLDRRHAESGRVIRRAHSESWPGIDQPLG